MNKPKFTYPLVVLPLPGGKKWRLVKSFSYYVGKQDYLTNYGIIIEVPAGFVCDGASIPKVFWSIIGSPMTGKYVQAAILHDFLYYIQTFSREHSDKIFLNAMKILGVSRLKRKIIYWAVRIGGKWAWNNHQKTKT